MAHRDDPTRRASVAMQILGDSGLELLPLLSVGSAGLSEMRNEARELARRSRLPPRRWGRSLATR